MPIKICGIFLIMLAGAMTQHGFRGYLCALPLGVIGLWMYEVAVKREHKQITEGGENL